MKGRRIAPSRTGTLDSTKVGKGKHIFQIRATDPAGNVDGSPATFDWKVKKKKKR